MVRLDPSRFAWCVIDDVAIFLDVAGDRYFRLPTARNADFLITHGGTFNGNPVQPDDFPLPATWVPPAQQSAARHDAEFHIGAVARALWMQIRIERRIAAQPFASVLGDVRCALRVRPDTATVLNESALRQISAFERTKLLRSAADRCVPRSIALAVCLARLGCRAHVVIGVKLATFAAHCWVQCGAAVLNDELEEVLRYSPILVL